MGDNEEEIDAAMKEGKNFLLLQGLIGNFIMSIVLIIFFVLVGDEFYGSNQEITPQIKGKYISSFIILLLIISAIMAENSVPQHPPPFTPQKLRYIVLIVIYILLLIPQTQVGSFFFNTSSFLENLILSLVFFAISYVYGGFSIGCLYKAMILHYQLNKEYVLYGSKGSRKDLMENLKLKNLENNSTVSYHSDGSKENNHEEGEDCDSGEQE